MTYTSNDERGSGLVEALVIIVILVAIGGVGWYVYQHKTPSQLAVTTSSNNSGHSTSSKTAVSEPLAAGTSNADLSSDLSNITSTSNQSSEDITATSSSLNDQSTMTTVPQ